MKLKFLSLSTVLLVVLLASLSSLSFADDHHATKYPVTIEDATGANVMVVLEPKRIISLLPSTTETLCALGEDICGRLVGRDAYSNFPTEVESVEEVGSIFDPNQEKIVAAEPDLVFSDKGETAKTYNNRLRQLGINVFASKAETYDEVLENIRQIGQIVNRQAEAEALIQTMQQDIDAVQTSVQDADKPTVLFYSYEYNGYGFAGSNSFIGDLIDQVNGENLITDESAFVTLTAEEVALLNPDIVIAGNGSTAEDLASLPGWSDLAAVQDGKVFTLNEAQQDVVSRPTPRMVDSIKIFGSILHPELVKAPF